MSDLSSIERIYGRSYANLQRQIDAGMALPDFRLDERGFTNRLPPAPIAPYVQLQAERAAAERNSRLVRDALGWQQQGLANLQTYRPGGVAALQSPYYSQMSQITLADRGEAPDLMFDWRRDEAFQERRRQSRARRRAGLAAAGGAVLGAVAGGLGAESLGISTAAGIAGGAALGTGIGSAIAGSPQSLAPAIGGAAGMFAGTGKTEQTGQAKTEQAGPAQMAVPGGGPAGIPVVPGQTILPGQISPGAPPPSAPSSGPTPSPAGTPAAGGTAPSGSQGAGVGGAGGSESGGGAGVQTGIPAVSPGGMSPSGMGSMGMTSQAVGDTLERRYPGLANDTVYAEMRVQENRSYADEFMIRLDALQLADEMAVF
jgi:hypothetical protein